MFCVNGVTFPGSSCELKSKETYRLRVQKFSLGPSMVAQICGTELLESISAMP